jgi:hypothetical protein
MCLSLPMPAYFLASLRFTWPQPVYPSLGQQSRSEVLMHCRCSKAHPSVNSVELSMTPWLARSHWSRAPSSSLRIVYEPLDTGNRGFTALECVCVSGDVHLLKHAHCETDPHMSLCHTFAWSRRGETGVKSCPKGRSLTLTQKIGVPLLWGGFSGWPVSL